MIIYQMDTDPWGLHQLFACPLGNTVCHNIVTRFDIDSSYDGHVLEGYCEPVDTLVESDAIIARALQEELSALATREACGYPDLGEKQLQASISAQDWLGPKKIVETPVMNEHANRLEHDDESGSCAPSDSPETSNQGGPPQPPEETDVTALVGEVEKRLDQMVSKPVSFFQA
ncbi:hypothetical protein Dimus_011501 [Dionaea muscipula]